MRCLYCNCTESKVIDSRSADDERTIRRRRECMGCGRRFTTYETIEVAPILVVKSDGTRQAFDLTGRLTVDTLRRDDYIDLAPADKQAWQRGFRYMTLGASFFGDNEVGVSASVPMVFEEDGCVVLFNEPLVMRWRLTPFGRRPTTDIDADIVNPMHMEMHYITYPLGEQFIALQSCKFTYPDFMTDDSCKHLDELLAKKEKELMAV